uniref:GH26 domain-containing protein n=1 Tax=Prevotella sp. GTC17259 TaxID=3236795 RepID=A0AB33J7I6_9BACT
MKKIFVTLFVLLLCFGVSARNADRKANRDAKALLKLLEKVQRKGGSLPAMMAKYDWNHLHSDTVKMLTGKYPAINCFDFMHFNIEGKKELYRTIRPVTEWTENGKIAAMMWHWNVPLSEGAHRYAFYNKGEFKAANCLKPGTWEHREFYASMDSVANIIKKLQDARVPIIFRPFHEGSGNASGTVWFWWGNGGAAVYKQLYQTMFHYFCDVKQLHNIVWAWNSNIYQNGATYDDASWYPGDEYVDIVGTENYDLKEIGRLKACYDYLKQHYSFKIIALTETNSQFKVSEMVNAGMRWTFIMPWCGEFFPKKEWWEDYFSLPNAVLGK